MSKKKKSKINKEILLVAYVFIGLFALLIGYFGYFITFKSDQVINNPYNARLDSFSDRIVRGKILSNDGTVLAETKVDDNGSETRVYPYGARFAHVIGYSASTKTGLEALGNYYLLSSHMNMAEQVVNQLSDVKNVGDNIVTTLNLDLQQVAYDALGNNKGAIVVMEPDTGKILAMVSKPDYNPNEISAIWSDLIAQENTEANLLNRATQGLYPPGSTFKILTALEYMNENPEGYAAYEYLCNSTIEVEGNSIRCYKNNVHGAVNLRSSFAKSCNTSFGNIGIHLNYDSFKNLAETFLFNKELPIPIAYKQSNFKLNGNSTTWDALQTSIGQGSTLVTPMHMALIVSSIANGGTLMNPYFIDRVENGNGDLVEKIFPSAYGTILDSSNAAALTDLMIAVVNEGTGSAVQSNQYQAAGKTGSAEFETGKNSHAWFVGFAPADNPKVVVSIIVEEGGAGGSVAAPIAKKLFDSYFSQ